MSENKIMENEKFKLIPVGDKYKLVVKDGVKEIYPVHIDMFLKTNEITKNQIIEVEITKNQIIEVEIPNSVTEIGRDVFRGCTSLEKIEIPNSITEIGDGAFERCESLKEIIIPNSVTRIDELAFAKCESLTEIQIPDSVTQMSDRVFEDCTSLKEIRLSNSLRFTNVGIFDGSMFKGCTSLKEIKYRDLIFTKDEIDQAMRYSIEPNMSFSEAVKKLWPEYSEQIDSYEQKDNSESTSHFA